MSWRAGELLDNFPEIALADVVDRRLLEIALLVGVQSRRVSLNRRPSNGRGWFGYLVGQLVKLPEVMISGAGDNGIGINR